jgi:tripartite-type tricarboxylate transporter receptor subunit TctC
MSMARRHFLRLGAAAAALPATLRMARSETYPSRPLRWVVGFPPGGAVDVVARLVGQVLAERLGQPVIVENKPGSANNLAVQAVVNSAADGYTLLLVTTANAINASLHERLAFDFLRDIAPVAGLVRLPLVMEVSPSFPSRTVDEFISYAKLRPGRIRMASSGIGTSPHLAGELFKTMTGTEMIHVPYRGEPPAIVDIMGGRVEMMFGSIVTSIDAIKAGKLRALAVTTAQRQDALPDVPTVSEFVPGYDVSAWFGVGVPKNTPKEIVVRLNSEISVALAHPRVLARLQDLGMTPMPFTPVEFATHIATETVRWGKIIQSLGLKVR